MSEMKILFVDDDAEDREIIHDAMAELHALETITFAENGEDALNKLASSYQAGVRPNLIVLDLNMPKMNGTTTLRYLKNDIRFKNIAVIIYSTSINTLEREQCISLGAYSYITKPLSYSDSIKIAADFIALSKQLPITSAG